MKIKTIVLTRRMKLLKNYQSAEAVCSMSAELESGEDLGQAQEDLAAEVAHWLKEEILMQMDLLNQVK